MKFIYPLILISLFGVSSCNKGSDFFEKELSPVGQGFGREGEFFDSPAPEIPAEEPAAPTEEVVVPEEETPSEDVVVIPAAPAEEPAAPAEESIVSEEEPEIPAEEPLVSEEESEVPAEEPLVSEEEPKVPAAEEVKEEVVAVEPEDEPIADESSCRYTVRTTSGGQNIKLTVISAPRHKLDLSSYSEFLALGAGYQDFVSRSVDDSHSNITTVASKSANQQTTSETLKISSADAKASITGIRSGVTLQYFFDSPAGKFSANQLYANSRVLIVMNSSDSGEVSFTEIGNNSEVFVVFLTQGHNGTCVRATGTKGEVASYVVSDSNQSAYSNVQATEFDSESIVTQSIIADRDAVSEVRATSLGSSIIKISSDAGARSLSTVKMTSGGGGWDFDEEGNLIMQEGGSQFLVSQRAQGEASFGMNATSAGYNTVVDLDVVSQTKASAQFGFTDHSNIEISGKLQAPVTVLDLDSRLQKSKTAKITLDY